LIELSITRALQARIGQLRHKKLSYIDHVNHVRHNFDQIITHCYFIKRVMLMTQFKNEKNKLKDNFILKG